MTATEPVGPGRHPHAATAVQDPSSPPEMIRLTLLGTPAVDGSGGLPGEASRPRSLALLALLAAGDAAAVPRDKLLLYLWPESDLERARNSLKQSVFELRRALGADAILSSGATLRLNRSRVACDLWEFEAAASAGDAERAEAVYRGPFLDGFFLSGLVEFERWADDRRRRLVRARGQLLQQIAERADTAEAPEIAVAWWRRAVEADPLASRAAVGLMKALSAAGHRGAALEHARHHAQRLRAELDADPDEAVTAFAARLRRDGADSGADAALESPADGAAARRPASVPVPESAGVAQPGRGPEGVGQPPFGRGRKVAWRVGAALVAAALAVGAWRAAAAWKRPPASDAVVAVFPFQVVGDTGLDYLGRGLMHLLSNGLDGAGRLRTIAPGTLLADLPPSPGHVDQTAVGDIARRRGAGRYVLGDVVAGGGRIQVTATLYSLAGGEPTRAVVEGPSSDIFGLVHRLASQLIGDAYRGDRNRLIRAAAASARSLPALHAYLAGEDLLGAGRYPAAVETLGQAVRLDSSFALAHYRLSVAADWAGQRALASSAAEAALRHADQLSARDRRLIEAYLGFQRGDFESAERAYRDVVDDYPQDVEAWFGLAEAQFHGNPLRGRSSTDARAAFERVLAIDPLHGEALVHLARIASAQGRRAEAAALARRALESASDSAVIELRAVRAFALGDRPGEKQVTRALLASPARESGVTALQVAVFLDDLDGTERFARSLADTSNAIDVRAHGHRMLAEVRIAQGRWDDAMRELDLAEPMDVAAAMELRSLFASLPFLAVPPAEIARIRDQVERWNPLDHPDAVRHSESHVGLHPAIRLHRLGLLSIALGDTTAARRCADSLRAAAASATGDVGLVTAAFAHGLRAELEAARGRPRAALVQFDSAGWGRVADISVAEARDRYRRAELLIDLGEIRAARGWLGSIAERASYELVYLAPAQLRLAELAERGGDLDEARRSFRRFAELWAGADARLQPRIQAARLALTRLERR